MASEEHTGRIAKKKVKKKQKKEGRHIDLGGFGVVLGLILIITVILAIAISISLLSLWVAFDLILGYEIPVWDLFIGSILAGLASLLTYFLIGIIARAISSLSK